MSSDSTTTVATDSVFIELRPLPEVNLGADTTLCGNGSKTLYAGDQGTKYLWSTGDTTQSIIVDSTTMFAGYGDREINVTVYGKNGCINSDTVIIGVLNCTGIDEMVNNVSMTVYPNPNTGEFYLDLHAVKDDVADILIFNEVGSEVYRNEQVKISGNMKLKIEMGHQASGIYQLFLRGKNSLGSRKIIVK